MLKFHADAQKSAAERLDLGEADRLDLEAPALRGAQLVIPVQQIGQWSFDRLLDRDLGHEMGPFHRIGLDQPLVVRADLRARKLLTVEEALPRVRQEFRLCL